MWKRQQDKENASKPERKSKELTKKKSLTLSKLQTTLKNLIV